jgi:ABC-type multidrug transport system permease subunit
MGTRIVAIVLALCISASVFVGASLFGGVMAAAVAYIGWLTLIVPLSIVATAVGALVRGRRQKPADNTN